MYIKVEPGHYRQVPVTEANIEQASMETFSPLIIGLFKSRQSVHKTHIRRTAPYANTRISLKGVRVVRKTNRSVGIKKPKEKQNKK